MHRDNVRRRDRLPTQREVGVPEWTSWPVVAVDSVGGRQVPTYCRIPLREAAAKILLDLERRALAASAGRECLREVSHDQKAPLAIE